MNQLLREYPKEVEAILAKYPLEYRRSAVMPLLYLAQRAPGYVPRQALNDVAELSGLSTTEISSIVGFYTLYYDQPAGHYRLQVCTDLPCALRGAEVYLRELCARLGIRPGETTPDGLFTLEEVKCLAACHRAPMFQAQGEGQITFHENQTVELTLAWMEEVRQQMAQKRAAHKEGQA